LAEKGDPGSVDQQKLLLQAVDHICGVREPRLYRKPRQYDWPRIVDISRELYAFPSSQFYGCSAIISALNRAISICTELECSGAVGFDK
jgi:predicted DNA-binding transcriptional regulator AlpA